jgi:hypothetical protein
MYSISSQVFEGLTDRILQIREKTEDDVEEQRGPIASGRVLADIVSQRASVTESRFLHDYAYTLFEKKLSELDRLITVSGTVDDATKNILKEATLVKISGPALLTDVRLVKDTVERYNEIGEALTYVSDFEQREQLKNAVEAQIREEKDKNRKARLREQKKLLSNIEASAKKKGLHLDGDFLKKLSLLLQYGFGEQLEVRIALPTSAGKKIEFAAPLNREYLREDDVSIVRKYSRRTQKELVLLGVATQVGEQSEEQETPKQDDEDEPSHMKRALLNMVKLLSAVEETFIGILENEVVIDPIAVYRTL